MQVKVTLSYDGSQFNGYQMQNSGVKTVANKLDKILKSLKIDTKIHASGRTDTGVHATNQVIHFEIPEFWNDLKKLKYMLNQKSLPDIYIKEIKVVDETFHARYSAKRRVYRYLISTKVPSVFLAPYILFVPTIDERSIEEAIKYFEGEHDFEYFKKSKGSQKQSRRIIYKARFYKHKEFYVFSFEANGYLRSQIRMMVHFLLEISDKRLTVDALKEQLTLVKRHSTGVVVPNGLYLSRIKY
ncbi:MAG TPA: tRNA pseudouridine(38-40) synthase TruA [Campylobacterales bacterium]|nr:tRNA pseudouridine(38-40) synthase TruA [Campylobacterales bacterium]HIP60141.1 tRNA pseudouridine(38-40) synthase TruA [Campylobacterales bacterium]